eukprot:Sspe_Gene.31978::Locus_15708_Transcript_1_1_Confidence_1.000_Length_1666::g.31978::m.31978
MASTLPPLPALGGDNVAGEKNALVLDSPNEPLGDEPKPREDPLREERGRCQPVFYAGWGGVVDIPIPSQYGKATDVKRIMRQAMRDAGKIDCPKFFRLMTSAKCERLLEDMYWYIFLDEFALVDPIKVLQEFRETEAKAAAESEKASSSEPPPAEHIPTPPRGPRPDRPTHLSSISVRNVAGLVSTGRRPPSRPTTPRVQKHDEPTKRGVAAIVALAETSKKRCLSPSSSSTAFYSHLIGRPPPSELSASDVESIYSEITDDESETTHPFTRPRSTAPCGAPGDKGLDPTPAREEIENELDRIYSRMAYHYVTLFKMINRRDKDLLLRDVPDTLSRALRRIFDRTLPYLKPKMGKRFRQDLYRRVSYWINGVEAKSISHWDTPIIVKKKPSKRPPQRTDVARQMPVAGREDRDDRAKPAATTNDGPSLPEPDAAGMYGTRRPSADPGRAVKSPDTRELAVKTLDISKLSNFSKAAMAFNEAGASELKEQLDEIREEFARITCPEESQKRVREKMMGRESVVVAQEPPANM